MGPFVGGDFLIVSESSVLNGSNKAALTKNPSFNGGSFNDGGGF